MLGLLKSLPHKQMSGSQREMPSHQGDLEVPAGGGEVGRGYCRNWVIDPQWKSGNLREIRSMHFRLLLLLAVGLFPGGPGSLQASGLQSMLQTFLPHLLCPCFGVS